ncbi:alpha/beta hydrolase fold domain-containing protein [Streptomyces sp. NPDC020096]
MAPRGAGRHFAEPSAVRIRFRLGCCGRGGIRPNPHAVSWTNLQRHTGGRGSGRGDAPATCTEWPATPSPRQTRSACGRCPRACWPALADHCPTGGRTVGLAAKADVDPAITAETLRYPAANHLDGADPTDGLVSPLFADLSGLPPPLILVGSHEIPLDHATRLAAHAAAADVRVTLDVTPEVPHVFQAFAAILDEGSEAITRAAASRRSHLAATATV